MEENGLEGNPGEIDNVEIIDLPSTQDQNPEEILDLDPEEILDPKEAEDSTVATNMIIMCKITRVKK